MNFLPTKFDRDVWIQKDEIKKQYGYICTHVDDFSIFAADAQAIMDDIKQVYTVKSEGPPDHYLGNNYKKDRKGR